MTSTLGSTTAAISAATTSTTTTTTTTSTSNVELSEEDAIDRLVADDEDILALVGSSPSDTNSDHVSPKNESLMETTTEEKDPIEGERNDISGKELAQANLVELSGNEVNCLLLPIATNQSLVTSGNTLASSMGSKSQQKQQPIIKLEPLTIKSSPLKQQAAPLMPPQLKSISNIVDHSRVVAAVTATQNMGGINRSHNHLAAAAKRSRSAKQSNNQANRKDANVTCLPDIKVFPSNASANVNANSPTRKRPLLSVSSYGSMQTPTSIKLIDPLVGQTLAAPISGLKTNNSSVVSSTPSAGSASDKLAMIPTLSSQLIFSSIITTATTQQAKPLGATQISLTSVSSQNNNNNNNRTNTTATITLPSSTPTTTKTHDGTEQPPVATTTATAPSSSSSSTSTLTNCMSTNANKTTTSTPSRTKPIPSHNSGSLQQNNSVSPGAHAATAKLMDMGKRLLEATRENRVDLVRQLVCSSGAPFTSDWLGTTALHLAAQSGNAEIAEILLRGGVNRDARTKLERTALHIAAQSGGLEVVDLLVNHGSDVNAQDMLKMTPLHWAAERGHVCVVERLLIGGADVNIRSKFQLTPIDIATNSQYYDIIELFNSWNCKEENLDETFRKLVNGVSFEEATDELLDSFDYHLAAMVTSGQTEADGSSINDGRGGNHSELLDDIDVPCIDLELEWNKLDFEPDLFLASESGDGEPKVEYLMKVVERLEMENRQLKQQVEQLSTPSPTTSP